MGRLEEIEYSINWTEKAMVSPHWTEYCTDCKYLLSVVHRLREALKEISEGKGRYDMDNHQHAINTIEDMKELAIKSLKDL